MLRFVDKYIYSLKEVLGVEIVLINDEEFYINYVLLSVSKSKVSFLERGFGINSFEELVKRIGGKIPVSLSITGQMIYTKIFSEEDDRDKEDVLFNEASPGLFFRSEVDLGKKVLLTVARNDLIEKVLEDAMLAGLEVFSLSVGYGIVMPLVKDIINDNIRSIDLYTAIIEFDKEREMISVDLINKRENDLFQSPEYRIDDIYVVGGLMIAFASAFKLLAFGIDEQSNRSYIRIKEKLRKYKFQKLFKFYSFTGLILILVALGINFMLFNHYFSENQRLQQKVMMEEHLNSQQLISNRIIEEELKVLSDLGWLNNSRMAYYADRVGGLVPSSIKLKSMKVFPFKAISGSSESVKIQRDTIVIIGECSRAIELNQYLNNLHLVKGFKHIRLNQFSQNPDLNGEFKIEISVKDE